jgi:hypothetical protein
MLAIFLVLATVLKNRNGKAFVKEGIQTKCKILENLKRRKGVTTSQFVTKIEYKTLEGSSITNEVPSREEYKVGDCYTLQYLKSDVNFVRMGEQIPCK